MAARKPSTPKTTPAGRKPRATPSVAKAAADPKPETAAGPDPDPTPEAAAAPETVRFKRPDLIEAVAAQSVMKRSEAKLLIDLVLQELATAIDTHEELVLPPIGKIMVKRRDARDDGASMLTIKLKRTAPGDGETAKTPLAETEEGS